MTHFIAHNFLFLWVKRNLFCRLGCLPGKTICRSTEIAASIAKLNDNYSDILYLKIAREYSNDEIANILGISKENAKMRLSRARKALKEILKKEGTLYGQHK